MGDTDSPSVNISDRDAITGANVLVELARQDLEHYNIEKADETLAVAQRLLIVGGSKDVGKILKGREL